MQIYITFSRISCSGRPGQPIARLTSLGWTCIGALGDLRMFKIQYSFARTYFVSDQKMMKDVNVVLRQFREIDSGGMESASVLTIEEKMAVKKS